MITRPTPRPVSQTVLLLVVLIPGLAHGAMWRQRYDRALDAYRKGQLSDSSQGFREAFQQARRDQAGAQTLGQISLKLALVSLKQGQTKVAHKAFITARKLFEKQDAPDQRGLREVLTRHAALLRRLGRSDAAATLEARLGSLGTSPSDRKSASPAETPSSGARPSGGSAESTPGPDPDTIIPELMEISGANEQLEALPQQVEIILRQQSAQAPPEVQEATLASMRESITPERFLKAATGIYRRHFDPDHAQRALDWLQSEAGRRLTQLEILYSTPEETAALQKILAEGFAVDPTPERIALMERFMGATRSVESGMRMQLASTWTALTLMNEAAPDEQQAPVGELEAFIRKMTPRIEEGVTQQTLVSLLHIYREATVEDLEDYLAFIGTPAGRWWIDLGLSSQTDAMVQTLQEAIVRLHARLAAGEPE